MNLFIFGLGYSALTLARHHGAELGTVSGTVRTLDKAKRLQAEGINAMVYAGGAAGHYVEAALQNADALIVSAAPDEAGDPMLRQLRTALDAAENLLQVIYWSTIGVYGDHGGAWIDENAPLKATSERGQRRIAAEAGWLAFGDQRKISIQLHRLAGIYGPGRSMLDDLKDGTARRIIKEGQVFNRIHVADIAGAAMAGLRNPGISGAFNICDDEPCAPQDVVAHGANLLGLPVPPDTPFAEARLSEMGRSFYGESKRCSNHRLRKILGYDLRYPTYREGLAEIAAEAEKIG
ncbi:MAG: SDR family oxidoreductase [Beijerinckiaceae bacterium]